MQLHTMSTFANPNNCFTRRGGGAGGSRANTSSNASSRPGRVYIKTRFRIDNIISKSKSKSWAGLCALVFCSIAISTYFFVSLHFNFNIEVSSLLYEVSFLSEVSAKSKMDTHEKQYETVKVPRTEKVKHLRAKRRQK